MDRYILELVKGDDVSFQSEEPLAKLAEKAARDGYLNVSAIRMSPADEDGLNHVIDPEQICYFLHQMRSIRLDR